MLPPLGRVTSLVGTPFWNKFVIVCEGTQNPREPKSATAFAEQRWLNKYSVPSLSDYGRTADSTIIWIVLGRRIFGYPRA
jgi:hypothetical protein